MDSSPVFETNLGLLASRHAGLARRVGEAGDLPPGMLFRTTAGYPNLRFLLPAGGSRTLYPGEVPDFRAEVDASTGDFDFGEDTATVLLGFGLGFLALQLVERMEPYHPFLIVEPDPRILKAAFGCQDLRPLLEHPKLYWATDDRELEAAFQQIQNDVVLWVRTLFRPIYLEAAPQYCEPLRRKIQNLVFHVTGSARFVEERGPLTTRNALRNLVHRITQQGVGKLFGRFKQVSAVLIGGGPSLEGNLHHLRGWENRVLVICSDSALRLTLALGITPHFVTAIDPLPLNRKKFEGVPVPPYIALVCPPVVNDGIVDRYPGPVLFHHRGQQDPLWSEPPMGEEGFLKPSTTVAHLSLSLALALGCDPIILIGQDLAFTREKTHAGDRDTWTFRDTETSGWTAVRDVWGREVKTIPQFLGFAQLFEMEAASHSRTFVNASEEGIPLKGYRSMRLKDALHLYGTAPVPSLQEPWWIRSIQGADRSKALAALLETAEDHRRNLKRLIQRCTKIKVSAFKGDTNRSAKSHERLEDLLRSLPHCFHTVRLLSGSSTTLLRWVLRSRPDELVWMFRKNPGAAHSFVQAVRKRGPEVLKALDTSIHRLRLLAAAERSWEAERWEDLPKQARIMRKEGLYAVALSLLTEILSRGEDESAVLARSQVLLELEQFPLLLQEDRLRSLAARSPKAARLREEALRRKEEWDRFVEATRKQYIPGRPDPERTIRSGALFYFRTGDAARANALLSEYRTRYGDNAEACCLTAEFLLGSGRWEEAARVLERALALEPDHTEARFLLARARIETHRHEEAERLLRGLLEKEEVDLRVYETLAELYLRWKRPAPAFDILRRGCECFPSSLFLREKLELVRRLVFSGDAQEKGHP